MGDAIKHPESSNQIKNDVLQEVKSHALVPNGSRVLIIDPGQYRASSSIGMVAALEQAGICASDFDHIVVSSSGVFAGVGFAVGRGVAMLNYCQEHGPSETLDKRLRSIFNGTILQTEKLLAGVLQGEKIQNEQQWYENPVLPENYHEMTYPNGRKNPVIHVVTSTTGDNIQPHYIRSDEISPLEFQKALAATLTLPRWSEPSGDNSREIGGKEYIDGFLTGEVMYDYARDVLGASHVVKLGNSNGPHLPPQEGDNRNGLVFPEGENKNIPIHINFWLKSSVLAKFFCYNRPESNTNEMTRMYQEAQDNKVKLLYVEPYDDAFDSPAFTVTQKGFAANVALGRAKMEGVIMSAHEPLPKLRYQEKGITRQLISAVKKSVKGVLEFIDLHRY